MTVTANASGVVTGKFTIPTGLPAGVKQVTFLGSGGSRGDASFVGAGTITDEVRRQVTTQVSVLGWASVDPLAQTFSVPETCQISAVDLWFSAIGTKPISVQIRETSVGFPTRTVVAETRVLPGAVSLATHTRISFPAPVQLLSNTEYALVVMSDDAVTELRMAELGKWDSANGRWVTSQPYQVGVLLSSSNASTWTAHQDRDLAFRLHKAVFTQFNKTVALGTVAVTNATDLLLSGVQETPGSATRISYDLTLPDGSVVNVASGQPVRLATAITGNVTVSAKMVGDDNSAPVLFPGAQLIAGTVATSATYVSRAITGGASVKVRAIFEANIPAGAGVVVHYKGGDVGDTWQSVPYVSSTATDSGFMEMTHEVTGVNEQQVQIRLTLTGTTAARPRVKNIRFLTV